VVNKSNQDLTAQIKSLASDKAQLIAQLALFERDSFEIQSKVQRGIEA
jgi:hypothetical protein